MKRVHQLRIHVREKQQEKQNIAGIKFILLGVSELLNLPKIQIAIALKNVSSQVRYISPFKY